MRMPGEGPKSVQLSILPSALGRSPSGHPLPSRRGIGMVRCAPDSGPAAPFLDQRRCAEDRDWGDTSRRRPSHTIGYTELLRTFDSVRQQRSRVPPGRRLNRDTVAHIMRA